LFSLWIPNIERHCIRVAFQLHCIIELQRRPAL
jgi:hypothetical protein